MAKAINESETSRRLDYFLDREAELIAQPHAVPMLH
jgi:hypothetical protein